MQTTFLQVVPTTRNVEQVRTSDGICNPAASKLLLNFQNSCGVHPASCSIADGTHTTGVKDGAWGLPFTSSECEG